MDRLSLVTRNTEEVVTVTELEEVLAREDPSVYIGYATTGQMHIGHYTTIRKLVDFLDADLEVTVLIADLHAHLDDEKSPFELLDQRSRYYQVAIEQMIDAAGGDPSAIRFVRGTEFELDADYMLSILRMATETTVSRARRAASEVVREGDSPKLGGLIYPLMQSKDVDHLGVDIAYGGIDQRGIYMLSRELLPEHGGSKPVCIFAPLLSGLTGEKMSASKAESTIRITDDTETIEAKVERAYCPAGVVENNGVLEYLNYLLFPIIHAEDRSFVVDRPARFGGPVEYENYDAAEADFVEEALHPADLKSAVATEIDRAIEPIRRHFEAHPSIITEAYPDEERP
ncbi:MAG: tyrosine--tRNA ligase [Halobacteriota archaeon]